MARKFVLKSCWSAAAVATLLVSHARVDAQTLSELIAGAKKEAEMSFVAGASTFGGRQAFAELQAAFNKKFALNARLNLTAGPSMPAMAARIITEAKAGRKSSTDVHLWVRRRLMRSCITEDYWSASTIRGYFLG